MGREGFLHLTVEPVTDRRAEATRHDEDDA